MRVLIASVALLLLSTCVARAPAPSVIPVGQVVAPNFRDADPVDFGRANPQRRPVQGIDAARFQSSINWPVARANGVNFAYLKATEGGDLIDPKFKDHWRGAGRAGVLRGAYHFYYFCTEPEVQARWFIRHVPRVAGSLPPVLDMEWNPFSPTCATVRPPAAEVRAQMRRWLRIVEAHYGQKAVIYTTPKFYRENDLSQFKGYDFWLRSTAKPVAETYPGQSWVFWQYSATGLIDGIDGKVDLNAFRGGANAWSQWVARRQVQ